MKAQVRQARYSATRARSEQQLKKDEENQDVGNLETQIKTVLDSHQNSTWFSSSFSLCCSERGAYEGTLTTKANHWCATAPNAAFDRSKNRLWNRIVGGFLSLAVGMLACCYGNIRRYAGQLQDHDQGWNRSRGQICETTKKRKGKGTKKNHFTPPPFPGRSVWIDNKSPSLCPQEYKNS